MNARKKLIDPLRCLAVLGVLGLAANAEAVPGPGPGISCQHHGPQARCTLRVSPAGGAFVPLHGPRSSIALLPDGSGYQLSGDLTIGHPLTGVPLLEADVVAEFADPSRPGLGLSRLRGSAALPSPTQGAGFGVFSVEHGKTQRVDLGLELGSILERELGIRHLNPARRCHGKRPGDAGFRECPYLFFRYLDTEHYAGTIGGTDIGFGLEASAESRQSLTSVLDPFDPFVYLGATNNPLESVSLGLATEDDAAPQGEDYGFGISRRANIPFRVETDWGIESHVKRFGLNSYGHLVVDGIVPLYKVLELKGSTVWRFPFDLDGKPQFDGHWMAAGNGDVSADIPLFKKSDLANWSMDLGSASAGMQMKPDRDVVYFSGVAEPGYRFMPEIVPIRAAREQAIRVAAVLAFIRGADGEAGEVAGNSFLQAEGSFLFDLGLGSQQNGFGVTETQEGFVRVDGKRGFEAWGQVSKEASGNALHPLLSIGADTSLAGRFHPARPNQAWFEITGEMSVGDKAMGSQAVLRINRQGAFVGTGVDFDLDSLTRAYNQLLDDIRAAEAEVARLDDAIAAMREIVKRERASQQAAVDGARAKVQAASDEVNRINAKIRQYESEIAQLKAEIASWKRWYDNQPWYNKTWAWTKYLAEKAKRDGMIAWRYTEIGALTVARETAQFALKVAEEALKVTLAALDTTPIDADPRVAALIVSSEVAGATLAELRGLMPEIPQIPGTLTARAGFLLNASGATPEVRAQYCQAGRCWNWRSPEFDSERNLACVEIPEIGRRVCAPVRFN